MRQVHAPEHLISCLLLVVGEVVGTSFEGQSYLSIFLYFVN